MTEDENSLLKKQLEELREQVTNKDHELKTYHRTISDLEKQLSEAENVRRRKKNEKFFVYLFKILSLRNDSLSLEMSI